MKSFRLFSIIILGLLIFSCSNQKKFDSNDWKNWTESENSPGLRWEMHKDLLKNYDLKAYNRQQIINLLGKPDSEINDEYHYLLGYTSNGIDTGTLIVTLKNDLVINIKVIDG